MELSFKGKIYCHSALSRCVEIKSLQIHLCRREGSGEEKLLLHLYNDENLFIISFYTQAEMF